MPANLDLARVSCDVRAVGDQESSRATEVSTRVCVAIVLTTDPSTTRALLDRFCYALGQATGLDVEPRGVLPSQQLLQELGEGELHLVWLPPIMALRATANEHVVPLALPVRAGASLYRATLFVRPDSPVRSVADLRGARAAWVDRQSATGYLIIRAHLEAQGVKLGEAFGSDSFLGTHEDVAQAVLDGEADVGASYVYLDEGATGDVVLRAGWGEADVHVVTKTGPIPADIIASDSRVPAEVQQTVQRALIDEQTPELSEATRELLAADGFIAPTAEHLEPLRRLLGSLKDATGTPHSLFPPPPRPAGR